MIFYLTYNDVPSGFFSQVIDVVNFFNNDIVKKTKLVSFISIRGCLATQFNFQSFEKKHCREIALKHFTKEEFKKQYELL